MFRNERRKKGGRRRTGGSIPQGGRGGKENQISKRKVILKPLGSQISSLRLSLENLNKRDRETDSKYT